MTDEQWFEMRLALDDAEMGGIQRLSKVRAEDEKWMAFARSKELRKIQAKAKEICEEIRKQVEIDVNSRPEFVALDLVSQGNRAAVTINLRMDPESVEELGYSKTTLAKHKALECLKNGGVTPQQAAEAIKPFARSLRTGKKLVDVIIRAGNKNETIERETTRRWPSPRRYPAAWRPLSIPFCRGGASSGILSANRSRPPAICPCSSPFSPSTDRLRAS